MKVFINCASHDEASLEDLIVLQGNLKDLTDQNYQKLKQQILDEGFIAPFFVWKREDGLHLLDGTQRFRTLSKMKEEGIELPEKFPIHEIYADSYKEACKRVLALASQYGTITTQGLHEFAEKHELEFEEVNQFHFDAFKMDSFKAEFYDIERIDEVELDEKQEKESEDKKYIIEVQFPNDCEMMDIHDDLLHRGYIVRIK